MPAPFQHNDINHCSTSRLVKLFIVICVQLISLPLSAQPFALFVSTTEPTQPDSLQLMEPDSVIRNNEALNEKLLDLVDVFLTDSTITRKTERHRVIGGGIARMVGFRWQTITWKKQKFIGTVTGPMHISGEERLSEYDVNFNMIPHLPEYIDLVCKGYERQKAIGRRKKKINYEDAPFIHPMKKDNELSDLAPYQLHNELTPPRAFRPMLNNLFYPTKRGNPLANHMNFGEAEPSIGMYGPYISDCNHDCHPEVHPYEWIWWLNLNPALDNEVNTKTWIFGLFREGSKRMPHWSPSPRIGEISIPFVFPVSNKQLKIEISHLVFQRFSEEGIEKLNVPEDASAFNFRQRIFQMNSPGLEGVTIKVLANAILNQQGIRFWFSALNYDEKKGLLSGKLNVAMAVNELYTAQVKVSY